VTALPVASAIASSECRSLLQFSSRNQPARSVGLTVHSSVGVSRNSALTYTYILNNINRHIQHFKERIVKSHISTPVIFGRAS